MKSYIYSIGSATPGFRVSQQESYEFICRTLILSEEEKVKMSILYRATGIDYRYTVLEDYKRKKGYFSFFPNTQTLEPLPTVAQRMEMYKKHALPLALRASENCFENSSIRKSSITHLITVSCTGMYAPGLDIEIIDYFKLKTNVQRTAVNFMGCYGAFNALKVADSICKANHEATVLVVCVELCSLHFTRSKEEDHLLSGAIFGDGAAAVLVSSREPREKALSMESFYCDLLREGHNDMAWHISDFGFQMKLSSYVPDLIKGGIKALTTNLLEFIKLTLADIKYFAIHPGGKRILQVIEGELGLTKEDNKAAYEVLKNYGNMSSPTVLFVLQRIFQRLEDEDKNGNILSFAFGPGLTLESMLLKIHF